MPNNSCVADFKQAAQDGATRAEFRAMLTKPCTPDCKIHGPKGLAPALLGVIDILPDEALTAYLEEVKKELRQR